jgi:hypothetical protein
MQKINTEIYTNQKNKRIEKSLLLLKIRRIEKSLLLLKIRRIDKSLLLPKIRRIEKSLRLQKIRRMIESLRALKPAFVEKPVSEEKPAGLEKQAVFSLFRLGGTPAADFFLVWLMSSGSDPRRCDESCMQSPSEEKAQVTLLLWAALSP